MLCTSTDVLSWHAMKADKVFSPLAFAAPSREPTNV
jgi:hypothetical protein